MFTEDNVRVTHGFELQRDPLVGPNRLEVNFAGNSFHLEQLTFAFCYDDPAIDHNPRTAPFDTMLASLRLCVRQQVRELRSNSSRAETACRCVMQR